MHIKNFDPYDFSKKEVAGVPVYWKNLPWAPCIHIAVVFNVGAFGDPIDKEGMAHFLEHLIGNGSPLLPDKKAVKEFSRLYMLNSRNAYTNYNQTVYTGKCLPENLQKVLEAIRDYVFNPFLRTEDVEHERKVITQEMWSSYKNEKLLNYLKEFGNNMYFGNERSRLGSPGGWPETIAKITQKDISDFHKKNYVKENLSVLLVGNVGEKDISLLDDFMKNIPDGEKSNISSGEINKPKQLRFEKTGEEIGDPKEQLEFSVYRALEKMDDEESKIGDQCRALLQDILFERLRLENSLCYGVSVYFYRYKDHGEVGITVKAKEENLAIIEKEVWNVINEIISGGWASRFDDVHKVYIDQIKSAERLSDNIIKSATYELVVENEIVTLEKVLEEAEKVTYEKVKMMIKKIFNPEWTITEIILPSNK